MENKLWQDFKRYRTNENLSLLKKAKHLFKKVANESKHKSLEKTYSKNK